MNKRGDDAVSPWVVGLVLLVIGAGVIAFIYYQGYGVAQDSLANVPLDALSTAKVACVALEKLAVTTEESKVAYCTNEQKILDSVYATCPEISDKVGGFEYNISCPTYEGSVISSKGEAIGSKYVTDDLLRLTCKDKVIATNVNVEVSQAKCEDFISCDGKTVIGTGSDSKAETSLGGTLLKDGGSCPTGKKKITHGFYELKADSKAVCCV